jgi:hypothetical protein
VGLPGQALVHPAFGALEPALRVCPLLCVCRLLRVCPLLRV